jgi:hypothetical protein
MKTAASFNAKPAKPGFFPMPGITPALGKGRMQATSIVLKTSTTSKRQHAAIGKLVQMCRESEVASVVSQGITAEVRRDRNWGHA